jgi:hypothetical protein
MLSEIDILKQELVEMKLRIVLLEKKLLQIGGIVMDLGDEK